MICSLVSCFSVSFFRFLESVMVLYCLFYWPVQLVHREICQYSRMGYCDEVTRGNEDWERSLCDGVKEQMRIGANFLLHNLGLL